ncbi:hypothetical protein SITYG_05720 [Streptococcus intermedius]|uniref:Uncharacterized protein n=1 Tax=Streptococcus intermedius TaxID=1338 RepID=A0AAD1FJ05_STRIT|nr:hypothetical protein SITYG_05720 [Streptococcus intermedius]
MFQKILTDIILFFLFEMTLFITNYSLLNHYFHHNFLIFGQDKQYM